MYTDAGGNFKQQKIKVMKAVKERDNMDLLELVLQLHSRALNFPSKEMSDAYNEARNELITRLDESTPADKPERDPFIEKHLNNVFKSLKQAQIELHIKPMYDSLEAASIKYFLEKGTVNGSFLSALNAIMDGIRGWQSTPADDWVKVEEVEKKAEQQLLNWLKEDPAKLTMFMLLQMGRMAVESNAGSLILKQESDIENQRYEIRAKITLKKIPSPPKK